MRYKDVKRLSPDKFKRLVGVQPATFDLMLNELKPFEPTFGRPLKLILEDRLLLALSYWREYRTLLHTGMSYGVSEASAHRIVQHIENVLISRRSICLKSCLKVVISTGKWCWLMQLNL